MASMRYELQLGQNWHMFSKLIDKIEREAKPESYIYYPPGSVGFELVRLCCEVAKVKLEIVLAFEEAIMRYG